MRAILQRIKDTAVYKNYTNNYAQMVLAQNLTRLANSENMFGYYLNTVQIMDMFRKAIVTLRTETKSIILAEITKVDQEYAMGIFILIVLFIISPLMVFLGKVSFTLTSTQLFLLTKYQLSYMDVYSSTFFHFLSHTSKCTKYKKA